MALAPRDVRAGWREWPTEEPMPPLVDFLISDGAELYERPSTRPPSYDDDSRYVIGWRASQSNGGRDA